MLDSASLRDLYREIVWGDYRVDSANIAEAMLRARLFVDTERYWVVAHGLKRPRLN